MQEFHIGDYVILNKDGCFTADCREYHAIVIGELDGDCYTLRITDETIREHDKRYGINRELRCLPRYMTLDIDATNEEIYESVDISMLL